MATIGGVAGGQWQNGVTGMMKASRGRMMTGTLYLGAQGQRVTDAEGVIVSIAGRSEKILGNTVAEVQQPVRNALTERAVQAYRTASEAGKGGSGADRSIVRERIDTITNK